MKKDRTLFVYSPEVGDLIEFGEEQAAFEYNPLYLILSVEQNRVYMQNTVSGEIEEAAGRLGDMWEYANLVSEAERQK